MKRLLRDFMRHSYLAGYALLLAATVTLAMAMVGPSAFAQELRPGPRPDNDRQKDDLQGGREAIRNIMLAQASPPKDVPDSGGVGGRASAKATSPPPGSPEATTTISGKQLPPPDPAFGGVITSPRPWRMTAKLNKLTIKADRPQLSPGDIKKLEETQRNNKMSE